jgi:hypothetical protein
MSRQANDDPDCRTRRDYGPVQLTDYLRQYHERVYFDRARRLGLLPEPDRARGRWSAALAEQIRDRWPEIAVAAECIGAVRLKERGWTEAMIRDLLGDPDLVTGNPHYKSAGPMRLWRLQRVEAAEAAPEFAGRKERAARQCAAAARSARTREIWTALGGGKVAKMADYR